MTRPTSATRPDSSTLPTQGEVETLVVRLSERLEDETETFAKLCEEEVDARRTYEHRYHTLMIHEANVNRSTERVRSARVALLCEDEQAVHRICDARLRAGRERLLSLRAQLSAVQTLCRTIGGQA